MIVDVPEDSDSDSEPVRPSQSVRKSGKQKRLDFGPASPSKRGPSAINISAPIRASKPSQAGIFGTQKSVTFNDSSSDNASDLEVLPPPKKSKRRSKDSAPATRRTRSLQQPPSKTNGFEGHARDNLTQLDGGSDSDDLPTTPALSRRKASKSAPQNQVRSSSPLIVSDNEDSDDVQVISSRKRLASQKTRQRESVSDDERSDGSAIRVASSPRKRLRGGPARSQRMTQEERQELEDEVNDLVSSGGGSSREEEGATQRPVRKQSRQKTEREKALERLKRARAGAPDIEEEEEEEENEDDAELEYEEEQDDGSVNGDGLLGVPYSSSRNMFQWDEDDEGFILEDDELPLGVPQGIPLEFTRFASMKAKELFKYAVEWMVQKKINPAFQLDDEIYTLTFKKLDDEVKGLAGSKFTSSAWTEDFTFALRARPEIAYTPIDRRSADHFMRDKCDACNRSGHPATFEIQFHGRPYHPDTLEEIAIGEDDSSDSDSDSDSEVGGAGRSHDRDAQGRQIPPEDTVFYVGKFCMGNAETAHALNHWKYHLYEWVVEYLESAGYNTPEAIVRRDKWSTKKRRKHANKIVDEMVKIGKVKALYQDFKNELDTARNSKQGRWANSP